jgi:drug/metabolite transporter (DMT)-like permease
MRRRRRKLLLLVRSIVGFAGIACYYWAVQLLPLADAAVFGFLSPLFVALAAPLILREGGGGWAVVAALPLCLTGVILVARPTFIFGGGSESLNGLGVAIGIMQVLGNCC